MSKPFIAVIKIHKTKPNTRKRHIILLFYYFHKQWRSLNTCFSFFPLDCLGSSTYKGLEMWYLPICCFFFFFSCLLQRRAEEGRRKINKHKTTHLNWKCTYSPPLQKVPSSIDMQSYWLFRHHESIRSTRYSCWPCSAAEEDNDDSCFGFQSKYRLASLGFKFLLILLSTSAINSFTRKTAAYYISTWPHKGGNLC